MTSTRFARIRNDIAVAATRPAIVMPSGAQRLGRRLPVGTGVGDRYSIKLGVSIITLAWTTMAQNIIRLASPGEPAACRPCLQFTATSLTGGRFDLIHDGQPSTSVSISNLLFKETFWLKASLNDKVSTLTVYRGASEQGVLVGSATIVHTLPYPAHSEVDIAVGRGARAARGAYFDLSVERTLMGGARAYFPVLSSSTLTNLIVPNGTVPTKLKSAKSFQEYTEFYNNGDPFLSGNGPSNQLSVCSSRDAALLHDTVDNRFVLDGAINQAITVCLWFYRTGAFDTIFSTIVDGVGTLRFYAFFDDVSLRPHGSYYDVRATPPERANIPQTPREWRHICAGASLTEPAKLWIDGELMSNETEIYASAAPAARPFAVGGSSDLGLWASNVGVNRGVAACTAEHAIWGRMLSNSDVVRVRDATLGGHSLMLV